MANTAVKFLTKHYKELQDNPLYGIAAEPEGGNLLTWCGNVFFPDNSEFPGLIVHFKLSFDNTYPNSSPNLKLCSDINHTHVYFPRCCFSLLPDFNSYFVATGAPKSAYWNPSRSVRNFLQSFYTFLVYDVDRESHGRSPIDDSIRNQAMSQARSFTCSCGHTFDAPSPSKPEISEEDSNKFDEDLMGGQGEAKTPFEKAKDDLKCGISGRSIDETVMGFGVHVLNETRGNKTIQTITTDLSPISYDTFYNDKVTVTSTGTKITHFLPFALNTAYWERAQQAAERGIMEIKNTNVFKLDDVLDVIGELWKTKVVEMMKGEEHASERLLYGFCAFHHLLLAFTRSYPSLVTLATDKVKEFLRSPDNRNKNACPDFGKFLPLFLISEIVWDENKYHAGRTCVEELFARNVFWILKSHPDLANSGADNNRVIKSWEPSQVGLKLTCFQIRYILEVGRPMNEIDIDANWERLNTLLGRPTDEQIQQFQTTVKRVQAIDNYAVWFQAMGLGNPNQPMILQLLQKAVVDSDNHGYTGRKNNNNNNNRGRGGGGGGRGKRY